MDQLSELHVYQNIANSTRIEVENEHSGGHSYFVSTSDQANISMKAHGSSRSHTQFGQTMDGWSEIHTSNGNGLILGTRDNKPLIFGTNDLKRMTVANTGNVGIGTTSPQSLLHVAGHVRIDNNQSYLAERVNGTVHNLLKINTSDHLVLGSSGLNDVRIHAGSATDAVYIKSGGYVGIGTDSPTGLLTLSGDSSNLFSLKSTDNSKNAGIAFQNSGGAYSWVIRRENSAVANNPDLVIAGGNASTPITSLTERLRIANDGTVGIGTNKPLA